MDVWPTPTRDGRHRKENRYLHRRLLERAIPRALRCFPTLQYIFFPCRNDLLLLTLIGWIKINSLHEQKCFINQATTRFCAKADVSHLFRRSIMKTPMNLLDRLNGIYSAKSEVPINWLVAAQRDTLDLFLSFLRRALLKRSMREALNQVHARQNSKSVFSVDSSH